MIYCKNLCHMHVHRPWAKCILFAAAALRPIFCGLIAASCLEDFDNMDYNIIVICCKAPYADMADSMKTINMLLLVCTVTLFGCRCKP